MPSSSSRASTSKSSSNSDDGRKSVAVGGQLAPPIRVDPGNARNTASSSSNNNKKSAAAPAAASLILDNLTLLSHFNQSQMLKGRPVVWGSNMMLTWRLTGHNEDTLRALCRKVDPKDQNELRIALMKEIMLVQSKDVPANVNISEVVDETVEYFLPSSQPAPPPPQRHPPPPQQRHPVMKRERPEEVDLTADDGAAADAAAAPTGDLGRTLSNRYELLEPFAISLVHEMKKLAGMRGQSDYTVSVVAKAIQKMLAFEQFDPATLRAMLTIYNDEYVINNVVTERLQSYRGNFSNGVTIEYVAKLLCEFVQKNN